MTRRSWLPLLVATAVVVGLSADQNRSPFQRPSVTRGLDVTQNALLLTTMGTADGSSRIMRIQHLDEGGWEEGPTAPGLTFWHPQDFVLDAAGRIYVADRTNRRIVRMDDIAGNGWIEFSGTGGNRLAEPPTFVNGTETDTGVYGLAFDSAERIYVTSAKRGRLIRTDNISGAGWRTVDFTGARDVALDRQGRIYLTDNQDQRIVRLDDMSGSVRVTFGTLGSGVGQLDQPNAVHVDAAGRIYIADEDNNRIVRINDMTGAGWTTFGTFGSGPGNLDTPHQISLDAAGRIWITDTGNRRVVRINSMAGDGFTSFGTRELQGRGLNFEATKYLHVLGLGPTLGYASVFPHVTLGSGVRASLFGVNLEGGPIEFTVNFGTTASGACPGDGLSDCGTPVTVTAGDVSSSQLDGVVSSMGATRLDLTASGERTVAYGRMRASGNFAGAVLLQSMQGATVTGETVIGASPALETFVVYVDERNGARTAYSIANPLPYGPAVPRFNSAQVSATVRNAAGSVVDGKTFNLQPGRQAIEYAAEAFPATIGPGFEGTITFSTRTGGRQKIEGVALRYESGGDVFTSLPVLTDILNDQTDSTPSHRPVARDQTTTRYFPHIADGGTHRTNFYVVNPFDTATVARFEFFGVEGRALAVPLGGTARTSFSIALGPRAAASVTTDGSSADVSWGWARVTASQRVDGAAVVQRVSDGQVAAEGAVPSSRLARRFITYVSNTGSTESGIAVVNPHDRLATLTLTLRNSDGEVLQAVSATLPAGAYLAQLTRQLFPGVGDVEGTIDVETSGPSIAVVGLRYQTAGGTVFTTVPANWLP